jgi:hypothetical protein
LKQADVSEQRRRKQGFPGPFANATRSGAFRSLVQRSTLFYSRLLQLPAVSSGEFSQSTLGLSRMGV